MDMATLCSFVAGPRVYQTKTGATMAPKLSHDGGKRRHRPSTEWSMDPTPGREHMRSGSRDEAVAHTGIRQRLTASSWPGSRPGHPRLACSKKDVDARHMAGHDGWRGGAVNLTRVRHRTAACTEAAVCPNRIARSSAVRMPPALGLISLALA